MGIRAGEDDGIAFGPFRLQPERRRLTRDGAPVRIGDRALDILVVLATHAPETVGKNALIEQVWPGLHVEDSNLRFQMVALRKALGHEDYISTVQGRGYCLVVPVERGAALEADATATNLLHSLTALIGRDLDLAELRRRLGLHRLVTVVGPGGVGKTRLAIETGRLLCSAFRGGVWLIDLAPLTGPEAVAGAIASLLHAVLPNGRDPIEAIAATLGKKRLLLIFDNCEHLVGTVAAVARTLLEQCPGLVVLATSQEPLLVPSEQLYVLPPLAVPSAGTVDIDGFGAVELFVERSRAADLNFGLHAGNIAGVGEICRQLDGVPLALEMAAARLKMLGVEGLCASLGDRLRLLKSPQRGSAARHGSLQAMVEWSHSLLDPQDRDVFRCLGVFPGSFSLDTAVAVASAPGRDRLSIVDALGRLIDKSLVKTENTVPPRYRLLETLRLYAVKQLRAGDDGDAVAERHARHFTDVLIRSDPDWEILPDPDWMALYRPELHNLRTALEWTLAAPERREIALLLAGPSLRFLNVCHFLDEGRRYAERLVSLMDDSTPVSIVASVVIQEAALGTTPYCPGWSEPMERAVLLYRQIDDKPRLGRALINLSSFHIRSGRYAKGQELAEESWKVIATSNYKKLKLSTMIIRGRCAEYLDQRETGFEYLTQAVQMAHDMHSLHEATCLNNLALLEYRRGNLEQAVERGREAIRCARADPRHRSLDSAITNLAAYLIALGRLEEARPVAEEAFAIIAENGKAWFPVFLQPWAVLAAFEGRLTEAAQLIGFVDATRIRKEYPRQPSEQGLYDALIQRLEAGLSAAELRAHKAEGASWSETQAVEFVGTQLIAR